MENIVFIGSSLLLALPLVHCSSKKKKFETDAKADLLPSTVSSPAKSPSRDQSSKLTPPTAQTPPSHTPIEKTGTPEEETLANIKSLPPEKSEAPDDKK